MVEPREILFSILGITLLYLFFSLFLRHNYETMVFYKQPENTDITTNLEENPDIRSVKLSSEGPDIYGWLREVDGEDVIIYFGGNAEEVSWMVDSSKKFENYSFAAFNYRGYGRSKGKPSFENIIEDSERIHSYLKENGFETIIVMGRSVGTVPAVHLSSKKKVEKTVLVSPFTSLKDVARRNPVLKFFSWIPKDLNLIEKAESSDVKMLMLTGKDDDIIPEEVSKNFYDRWAGNKSWESFEGRGHNDIQLEEDYWKKINHFINE